MVLFRRWKVFVWASGLVFAAAILYATFGLKYEADLKVLVRKGRADAPVTAGENAPVDLTHLDVTEEELNSEVELLRDDDVLRKVAAENGLGQHDWLHFLRPWEGPAERGERAARRLGKKLDVEAMKKTNLIAVRYASDNPQVAAKVLHSVARAYLDKHMAVHRPRGEFRFFEQQMNDSRGQLETAKQKLLQFTAAHGVVVAAEQRDFALQKLSDTDGLYRQAQVDLQATRDRIRELRAELATMSERTTTQVRTSDNPDLLRALKSSLLDLQLKRTQLLTKFEPNHRLVQEVEQQIAQAQAAITAENRSPLRDETTDKNAHYEWAQSELQQAQVQLTSLEGRAAAERAEEAAYRAVTQQLGEDAITQDDLTATEKTAEDNYLLYVKKLEEARMDDALDQRGIVNVAIAEEPVAPLLPVWSAWMVLAVGLAGAGVAGTGAAFVADSLDPSFRTPDEVVAYLNAPVLASLPRSGKGKLSA